MLPSYLLRVKIAHGSMRPSYVDLDADHLALSERIAEIYREGVGKRKGELIERMKKEENNEGHDFKLVRGLSVLLERRCVFEADSALNPAEARRAVFKEASRVRTSSSAERDTVLRRVSAELGVSNEALERTLFSDIEDELILRGFRPLPDPGTLLKQYNLSMMQTLLFKSLRVEFSASGNWKYIFRKVKWLGLIYSVERPVGDSGGTQQQQQQYKVSLDGPLSLFKMTERYGTSIAKLLPGIMASGSWSIKAEILARSRGGKVYNFEANSEELKDLVASEMTWWGDGSGDDERQPQVGGLYDSSIEERFARSFLSYGTGWALIREPEPLLAGTQVLIPDFGFEKDGMKVYLEIVGFWTPEYLRRKIAKLNSIVGTDMIIAADESLSCSKLERLREKATVVYYKREVPLKPIIEYLRKREASIIRGQVEKLKGEPMTIVLDGDVVSIEQIANQRGVKVGAIRIALQDFKPEGYVRVSDRFFISRSKLGELAEKLTGVSMLGDALKIIEASGIGEEGDKVLESLGYVSIWEGMDMDRVKITKKMAG